MFSQRHQRGFSYIWVLLLVALLGLGLVKAAEVVSTSLRRDQEQALLAIGNEFRNAIGRYHEAALVNGEHRYPETLDALLRDDRFPEMRRYLRRIYADPLSGKSEWGLIRLEGRIVGVHSLSPRPALKQQGFEVQDLAFTGKQRVDQWIFAYPPEILQRLEQRRP